MSRRDRREERRSVLQHAWMERADGSHIGECDMVDVSAGGARLQITGGASVPNQFVLMLSPFEPRVRRHCTVAWRDGTEIGIRFLSG